MILCAGIIGCGAISQSHLEALCVQAGARVIACTDVVPDAARRRAEQFDIPHVDPDAQTLLARDDLELVCICVPPKWHAELFLQALAAGKHVLMEKPLAMDMEEADRMVRAAAESDRIVGVALIHRYLPVYSALRDLIQGGAIGAVRRVRLSVGRAMYGDSRFATPEKDPRAWLVDRSTAGGGMLMSSSIHFLSAVSYVLNGPTAGRVTARLRELHPRSFPGIEDEIDLWIELDGGVELILAESWVHDRPYRAEYVGQCGQLVAGGEDWLHVGIDGSCEGPVPEQYRPFLEGKRLHAEPAQLGPIPEPLFGGLMADFLGSIQQGTHLPRMPGLLHARNMQAILAAAYRSQETDCPEVIQWRS